MAEEDIDISELDIIEMCQHALAQVYQCAVMREYLDTMGDQAKPLFGMPVRTPRGAGTVTAVDGDRIRVDIPVWGESFWFPETDVQCWGGRAPQSDPPPAELVADTLQVQIDSLLGQGLSKEQVVELLVQRGEDRQAVMERINHVETR